MEKKLPVVAEEEVDELPSTQPLIFLTQPQLDDPDPPVARAAWGRLLPISNKLPIIELINECYDFGRHPSCSTEFKEDMFNDKRHFLSLSKIHFKITRDFKNKITMIEDLSSNGTYINGNRITGNTKRGVLQHNQKIELAHKNFSAFVYVDLTKDQQKLGYPQAVLDKYHICQVLGQGASGDVRLVFEKDTCQRYALKIINKRIDISKGMNTHKCVQNEINILNAVKHPCIVKVENVMDFDDQTFIVMEYMEGGTLASRVHVGVALSENVAKLIFYQLLLAVQYLHSNKIAHRDLKPENVLLQSCSDEPLVKVSDFGLSKLMVQDPLVSMCGTLLYLAPEMVQGRGQQVYTPQVDVWSLGVILYQSLVGRLPFNAERTDMHLGEQITSGSYNLSDRSWLQVSAEARAIVRAMLTVDPNERPTIPDVFTSLWLQDELMKEKVRKLTGIADLQETSPSMSAPSSSIIRSFELVAQQEKEQGSPEPKRRRKLDTPPSSAENTRGEMLSSPDKGVDNPQSAPTPPTKQLNAMSFTARRV